MTPVILNDLVIGHEVSSHGCLVFFGNKHSLKKNLALAFPELKIHFLKQIHSGRVIPSEDIDLCPSADGHWTNIHHRALTIKTADCTPVLLASKNRVAAIHAGWRGVVQNIVKNAVDAFEDSILKVYIGPNIGPNNFEVETKVGESIVNSAYNSANYEICHPHKDPNKIYIDLSQVIISQIHRYCGKSVQIQTLKANTYSDENYFSYRRQGQEAGRQLSFIAKIPD